MLPSGLKRMALMEPASPLNGFGASAPMISALDAAGWVAAAWAAATPGVATRALFCAAAGCALPGVAAGAAAGVAPPEQAATVTEKAAASAARPSAIMQVHLLGCSWAGVKDGLCDGAQLRKASSGRDAIHVQQPRCVAIENHKAATIATTVGGKGFITQSVHASYLPVRV